MKTKMNRRRFFHVTTVSIASLLGACGDSNGISAPNDLVGLDLDTVTPGDDVVVSFDVQSQDGDGVLSDSISPVDLEDLSPEPVLFDPSVVPEDLLMFEMGVQSGDVLPNAAILWTRFTGTAPLELVLFEPGPGETEGGVQLVRFPVTPDPDGFVHVDLLDLVPNTAYGFCFRALEFPEGPPMLRSLVGRFRTAPASDQLVELTVGGVSCTNENYAPFPALSQAGGEDLDLFILGGDMIYADGSSSLGDYRSHWRSSLSSQGYRDLTRSVSTLSSWDDHEVDNNWDPEGIGAEQMGNARRAFFDHLPIRPNPDDSDRIWRSFRWGKTLEVFVLDCRGERKPSTRNTNEAEYISPEQFEWLVGGVQSSDAVFKMVMNSVPITNMPSFYLSESDRWEGYSAQRDALLTAIGYVPGLFFVSGDFHFGGIMKVEPPSGTNDHIPEILMGPGGQFPNPAWLLLNSSFYEEQFPFLTGENNYTRFKLNPLVTPPTITVDFINGAGSVFHSSVLSF
jgi:alkaline phosphatase D